MGKVHIFWEDHKILRNIHLKFVLCKGGFKSENVEGFSNLPKNIPKSYLKFVHPVHHIDETSILNFFDYTSLTYLQLVQKDF